MSSLSTIITRLHALGIQHTLDGTTVGKLTAVMPSDQFKAQLDRAETGDSAALNAVRNALIVAGLLSGDTSPAAPSKTAAVPEEQMSPAGNVEGQDAPWSDRPSHHVYGGKGALTLEVDQTRAGVATIAIDGAKATGPKQYNWKQKVRVQMTRLELPVVLAALLRLPVKCEFGAHGPDSKKGFGIEWQADKNAFYVKVFDGTQTIGVPMNRQDAFIVQQLVLRAMMEASPAQQSAESLMVQIRALYA